MRITVDAWPEIVLLDGTHKLLLNGFVLLLLLVKDSNGISQIGGVALLKYETANAIAWVLKLFKAEHERIKISCFMSDKSKAQMKALAAIFPGIVVYLCSFHTIQTFDREITCEKLGIDINEKSLSINLLHKLIYSKSQEEYNRFHKELKDSCPKSVVHYFNKNWDPIQKQWSIFGMTNANLGNFTNNGTESLNARIKGHTDLYLSLLIFFQRFFGWLRSRSAEDQNVKGATFLKVFTVASNDTEKIFRNLLTPFAYERIKVQLLLRRKVNIVRFDANKLECTVRSGDVHFVVSTSHCQCNFFKSNLMACRHIFATRSMFKLNLFDSTL